MDLAPILDRIEREAPEFGPPSTSLFWRDFAHALPELRRAGDNYEKACLAYNNLIHTIVEECPGLNFPSLNDLDKAMDRWRMDRNLASAGRPPVR